MSLADSFCSSPWIHMRINNAGQYEYCRWAQRAEDNSVSIKQEHPVKFFQKTMSPVRELLINGQIPDLCDNCATMEVHKKVSGRQRQLLKVGVVVDHFTESLLSSPWLPEFEYSSLHHGDTTQYPQDWQINLGNYCNNACIFCSPGYSSSVASDYLKIGLINQLPPTSWCNDSSLLAKFLGALKDSPKLQYLHFIGGETLITPAFRTILEFLIQNDLHKQVTVGFTTNLSTWDQGIIDLLVQFGGVNLGMSIECLHPLNDYLRYGSKIDRAQQLLSRWLNISKTHSWYTQLRITPTVFSVWYLDTVYEYAYENNISVESCNFLHKPEFMRPSVLSAELKKDVVSRLSSWIEKKSPKSKQSIINTRNPAFAQQHLLEDATSYINYLKTQPSESYRLPDLVSFLKRIEPSRKNSILDYLPEYEDLLRSAGY